MTDRISLPLITYILDKAEACIEWAEIEPGVWEPRVEVESYTVELRDIQVLKPSADPEEMKDYEETYGVDYSPELYHYWDGECYHTEMSDETNGCHKGGFEKWLNDEVDAKIAELNGA